MLTVPVYVLTRLGLTSMSHFIPAYGSLRLGCSSVYRLSIAILLVFSLPAERSFSQANEILILKNGMQIGPGQTINIPTLNSSTLNRDNQKGEVPSRNIVKMDDGLRETYFHMRQIAGDGIPSDLPITITHHNIKDRATQGLKLAGFRTVEVSPFDDFGRRRVRVENPQKKAGSSLFIQGITEVTPLYVRVDNLICDDALLLDSRHALSTIPSDQLKKILLNNARQGNTQDYLDIASLFDSAKRYPDAIAVMEQAMKEMPELEEDFRRKLDEYRQDFADQMFEEVELRRSAGQYQLAASLLQGFDPSKLAVETKLKIETRKREDLIESKRFAGISKSLREQLNELSDKTVAGILSPIVDEIAAHLNGNTIDRMALYERIKDDAATKGEQKVALAISGWIFGGDAGIDSLTIAKSSVEARELIRQYLLTHDPTVQPLILQPKRIAILEKIRALEAGSPVLVNRILAKMLPPLPLPEPFEGQPLRFLVDVPVSDDRGGDMGKVSYLVQLPPEYDPYRTYPCIVTLNGGTDEGTELEWWTGSYNPEWKMSVGLASRAGYIVISPRWRDDEEGYDQVTETEHHRVLAALRDAMRRTSIDTDRVFLAGHRSGGTAAWDLAVSQPSLWAGLICIGGNPTQFTLIARDNVARLPVYFVTGEFDGIPSPLARKNGAIWHEYASDGTKQDFMLTIYKGRGSERFQEELPRIIDWMNAPSHRRLDMPESFEAKSSRPGNRFFWWLEIVEYRNAMTPPFEPLDTKRVAEIKMTRRPLQNAIVVDNIAASKYRLWFNPQVADLTKKVKLTIRGESRSELITPSIEIMLEDARRRADRQHVFWAKYDVP